MKIVEIGLTGQPEQLPNEECGAHGCILLRPLGAAAMLLGSSATEVNFPLPVDFPMRVYPKKLLEMWVLGTAGQTLHIVID
jgi:hypothetical protein